MEAARLLLDQLRAGHLSPPARPVLVAGEALVDVLVAADGTVLHRTPGGAPLNVAVGLARLGVPTQLLTWYAADADGARIDAHLAASGVTVARGSRAAGSTPTARAVLDAERKASYEFALTWDPPAVSTEGFAAVHVGSLGTVVPPGAGTVRDLVRRAGEAGVPVTYDPNVRPALSPDRDTAWSAARRDAARATVVKLSDEDAEHLRPGTAPDAVLDELLTAPATRLAVLTRGRDGARLATRSRRVEVAAPAVAVVDTVGAGDAFMAGLLAALHARELLDAARLDRLDADDLRGLGGAAASVAALTCTRRGADPPWRHEVEPLASL